jgi:hypothetical protein
LSHRTSSRFWRAFEELPAEVQKLARENYDLLKSNPQHPSLHFKRVGRFWSARVGSSHRVLGIESPVGIVWFWIGLHEEYERLIKRS